MEEKIRKEKIPNLVSIITVNYNGYGDTCELIESLSAFETWPYEIIVVDNASVENEAVLIKKRYPGVKVLRSDRNLGFAGGNNLGYIEAVGDYIFYLNNDTIIKGPILEPLVKRLQMDGVGGVSPMIRFHRPPHAVQYYGWRRLSTITLKIATPPYNPATPEYYMKAKPVGVLHGAAMMFSRVVHEQIGEMREIYFLYYEEYDMSYRVANLGLHPWYEPAALVYHKEGTKRGMEMSPFREYFLVRSRVLFARIHLCGIVKFLACAYLFFIVMVRNILKYIWQKRWQSLQAVVKGTFSGLMTKI